MKPNTGWNFCWNILCIIHRMRVSTMIQYLRFSLTLLMVIRGTFISRELYPGTFLPLIVMRMHFCFTNIYSKVITTFLFTGLA